MSRHFCTFVVEKEKNTKQEQPRKTAGDGIEKAKKDMIATYQQSVESKTNKLTAIIAAGDIRTFVNYAKTIEFRIKQREPNFVLTWRKVTTGLILGYLEHQGRRYDNTYKYLNRISSNLIDFFEYLKAEKGREGENPAILAQKYLFENLNFIRWNAAESYRLLDAYIRKVSNTTAAGAGLHAARTEEAAPAAPARRKATDAQKDLFETPAAPAAPARRKATRKRTRQAA